HEESPGAARELLAHQVFAIDRDIEEIVPLIDEIESIQDVGSEEEHLPEPVRGARLATEHTAQIVERMAPCLGREQKEIQGDEKQKETPDRSPQSQRYESHEAQQRQAAALGTLGPLGADPRTARQV